MNTLDNHVILETIDGHVKLRGRTAGAMKNTIYKVLEGDKEVFHMCVGDDNRCILCKDSYQKVLDYEKEKNDNNKLTFSMVNDYVGCKTMYNKSLYIHQIIMDCYKNGKGTMNVSVDHIDRNPLNNTMANLRIATRDMQQQNSHGQIPGTKRARNSGAQDLPEGLEQNMIPKHVTYMKSVYNAEKGLTREYFRIENHPNMAKSYDGSKSNKVPILDKLKEITKIVNELDKGILPQSQKDIAGLPQYVRFIEKEDKRWLLYERRTENGRHSLKIRLPTEYDLNEQIDLLLARVSEKYDS